jgi:hypothetical protein
MSYRNTDQKQKDGFGKIHDMFTAAKSVKELTAAVQKAIPMMKDFGLDDYQQKRLEEYGMKCFDKIMIRDRQLEQMCKTNKFRK